MPDGSLGGREKVSNVLLLRTLFNTNWSVGGRISEETLDTNFDGSVSKHERLRALTNEDYCDVNSCTQSDGTALIELHTETEPFTLGLEAKDYELILPKSLKNRWGEMTNGERLAYILKSGEESSQGVQILCQGEIKRKSKKQFDYAKVVPEIKVDYGFRLTGKRQDLARERDPKKIRLIAPARFVVTNDFGKKDRTWLVDGYAGYKFSWLSENSSGHFVPFVNVVEKRSLKNGVVIDKLGVGVDALFNSRLGKVIAGTLYLTDSKADKELLTGSLIWTLPITSQFFGSFDPIGDETGLEMKIEPRLLADAGHVVDRGNISKLVNGETYARLGGGGRVQIRGTKESAFKDFLVDVDGKYLAGVAGSLDEFYRVTSSVNYFFPGQDHFSMGLSHTYGLQNETLQNEHVIEVTLGARF